ALAPPPVALPGPSGLPLVPVDFRRCRRESCAAAAGPHLTASNRRTTAFTELRDRRGSVGWVELVYWLYRPGLGWEARRRRPPPRRRGPRRACRHHRSPRRPGPCPRPPRDTHRSQPLRVPRRRGPALAVASSPPLPRLVELTPALGAAATQVVEQPPGGAEEQ